ncbi:hypothetical protein [Methylomonas sp. HYX-M1]|uniref:hypothetical protein n=1 Tax=Methylomonas sp. HYX-M1 TaxID=3139307 RepID=UPI00345BB144
MDTVSNTTTYVSRKCYFQLSYFDYDFLYPKVDTVVYLGNAYELKDKLPTEEGYLYFQDAESYANHGFLNSKGHKLDEGEMVVMQKSEAIAKKTIIDINSFIEKFKNLAKQPQFS